MTNTPNLTNGKSIADLDLIISDALAAKQALADAKIEKLFAYIEAETEDLHITTKQLLAAYNKWKRKALNNKDNGASEE